MHRPSLGSSGCGLLGALTVIAHSDGSADHRHRPWATERPQGDGPARGLQGGCSKSHPRQCIMPRALSGRGREVGKALSQPAPPVTALRPRGKACPASRKCAIAGCTSPVGQSSTAARAQLAPATSVCCRATPRRAAFRMPHQKLCRFGSAPFCCSCKADVKTAPELHFDLLHPALWFCGESGRSCCGRPEPAVLPCIGAYQGATAPLCAATGGVPAACANAPSIQARCWSSQVCRFVTSAHGRDMQPGHQ